MPESAQKKSSGNGAVKYQVSATPRPTLSATLSISRSRSSRAKLLSGLSPGKRVNSGNYGRDKSNDIAAISATIRQETRDDSDIDAADVRTVHCASRDKS